MLPDHFSQPGFSTQREEEKTESVLQVQSVHFKEAGSCSICIELRFV